MGYHSGITEVLTEARGTGLGTLSGGQFDWGGRLLKSNGGVQRFPQCGWKSHVEYKGRRGPDCEADEPSRVETRA